MLKIAPRGNFQHLLEHFLFPKHSPEHFPKHFWSIFGAFALLWSSSQSLYGGGIITVSTFGRTYTAKRPDVAGVRVRFRCGGSRTLCYAIVLPGRNSDFRAGFRPDSSRDSLKIGCPSGRPKAGRGAHVLKLSRLDSEIRPGGPISGMEALLRNIW